MALQQFRLIVDSAPTDVQIDLLFALPDQPTAEIGPAEGIGVVWFDRYADRLVDAIAAAVRDVERIGLRPLRVEAQDWVTIRDVALRIGRTPGIVHVWATAEPPAGGLPAVPEPELGGNEPLYSWAEMLPCIRCRLGVQELPPDEAPVLAAASLAIQLRRWAPRIDGMEVIRGLLGADR